MQVQIGRGAEPVDQPYVECVARLDVQCRPGNATVVAQHSRVAPGEPDRSLGRLEPHPQPPAGAAQRGWLYQRGTRTWFEPGGDLAPHSRPADEGAGESQSAQLERAAATDRLHLLVLPKGVEPFAVFLGRQLAAGIPLIEDLPGVAVRPTPLTGSRGPDVDVAVDPSTGRPDREDDQEHHPDKQELPRTAKSPHSTHAETVTHHDCLSISP